MYMHVRLCVQSCSEFERVFIIFTFELFFCTFVASVRVFVTWTLTFAHHLLYKISFHYSAPVGVRSIVTRLFVRLSLCLSASTSLEPLDRSLPNLVCRSPVAGPPLATLRYVMYFRFYG